MTRCSQEYFQVCADAGMTLQAEHERKMALILPKEDLRKARKVYIFQNLFFKRPYWMNLHPQFPGEAAFDARLEKFLAAGPSEIFKRKSHVSSVALHSFCLQSPGWSTLPGSEDSSCSTSTRQGAFSLNCWFFWQNTAGLAWQSRRRQLI